MENGGIVDLAARLRAAARVTVLTGAGVSAASGVPTFRGDQGLWRQFRPEDLATPDAFRRDPALVWEWYSWRRQAMASCSPNAAHQVIARWTRRSPECRVITQNVDDLHVQAGTRQLVRLHGSLWEMSCAGIGSLDGACAAGRRPWRDERALPAGVVPRCPYCGGLARPAVVWFGEALAREHVEAARRAAACDLFLTIGTSSLVYPAAGLVHEARDLGAFTVEINLAATPVSATVDLAIPGAAEQILPAVDSAMQEI